MLSPTLTKGMLARGGRNRKLNFFPDSERFLLGSLKVDKVLVLRSWKQLFGVLGFGNGAWTSRSWGLHKQKLWRSITKNLLNLGNEFTMKVSTKIILKCKNSSNEAYFFKVHKRIEFERITKIEIEFV